GAMCDSTDNTAVTTSIDDRLAEAVTAKICERPVNLRENRLTEVLFPDGLPPGAVITIDTVQETRGKRIGVTLPAAAKIKHRKKTCRISESLNYCALTGVYSPTTCDPCMRARVASNPGWQFVARFFFSRTESLRWPSIFVTFCLARSACSLSWPPKP